MRNMEELKRLGDICRIHRINSSMSQSEVALLVNCSVQNISAFENGRNNSAFLLLWYARKFDFNPIEELLKRNEKESE